MTIHYHGTPITPRSVLAKLAGRFFCVSFAQPQDIVWAHHFGQGVMLDNGAFSVWKRGIAPDWAGYYAWTDIWLGYHTTWAVIPDSIEGGEGENDALIRAWPHAQRGAPVWHMHEPIARLLRLCDDWPRVCIGSSAQYAKVGDDRWHNRMNAAMNELCRGGRVPTWLHMLRGMAAAEWGYPFSSVDSTDIARNHNRGVDVVTMANRWDSMQCSPRWTTVPLQMELA